MFKPMLAVNLEGTPRFPVMASYKIDGIRALVRGNHLVSRKLKSIPNNHTWELFSLFNLEGFDGELVVGNPWDKQLMSATNSAVMTQRFKPDVRYFVFDLFSIGSLPFLERYRELAKRVDAVKHPKIVLVEQKIIHNQHELDAMEADALSRGYEGLIIRDPNGPYKEGRSTLREGWMLKVKRFVTDEAIVVGVEEMEHNDNAPTVGMLGETKRSSHKANKRPSGMAGALVCIRPNDIRPRPESEFRVSLGSLTLDERKKLWEEDRETVFGCVVTYRHFAVTGVKDAPRFPLFVSFRHPDDT